MPLEDFPDTPRIEGALLVGVFPGDVFKGLAKRLKAASIKAASTTRLALTGVNIVSGAGRVKFAATDGHRLLLEEYATGCSESGAVLVNAAELARIATLVKIADIVRLEVVPAPTDRSGYANRARLVVSFSSATYQLRGISEEFPDFERVIPSGAGVKFTIGRRLFASAIARGGIVANDAGAVTLALESGSSVLSMSSGSRDKGNYSESLRLSAPTWESCAPVSFSGAYIADVLKLGKSGSVSVTLGAPLQAALFSTDGDTVPGRTRQAWVLMPLNPDDV